MSLAQVPLADLSGAFEEGPAFPWLVKALASLLVLSVLVAGANVIRGTAGLAWTWPTWAFIVATLGLIAYCHYWILFSCTRIDNLFLSQTWMWNKRVALEDITQAKFIYLPYLAWLVAPRLVLRVRARGVFVFHTAHPGVMRAFARLSLGYAHPVASDACTADTPPLIDTPSTKP